MVGVIRVGKREALEDAELRLDQVEPRRLGRRPDGLNAQVAQ